MKRTPLRSVSAKRAAENVIRRQVVGQVIERDKVCQFFPVLTEYMQITRADLIKHAGLPKCSGPLTAHEMAHSRNVGRIDPDASMAMCWGHNGWLEDCVGVWREHAYGSGLLIHGNGLPIRK